MVDGPKTELQSRSASASLVAPTLRRRRWDLCYIGLSHVVTPVSFSAAFWEGGWRGAPNKVDCEQKQKIECLLQVIGVEKGDGILLMSFELTWWFICVYVCLLWLGLVHCSASYNICLYSIIQFFSTLGGLFPQQNSLSRLESCGHEGQMKIEMYIHYGRTMSRRRNICNC